MSKRFLNNFFSCNSKIDILRTIISALDALTGRQIASLSGHSPRSCQLSLDELVRFNVLTRVPDGKAYYYYINLDNQIVTDLLIPVIQQEERLTKSAVDAIRLQLSRAKTKIHGIYFLESWPRDWTKAPKNTCLLSIISENTDKESLIKLLDNVIGFMLENFGMTSFMKILTEEEFSDEIQNHPGKIDIIKQRLKHIVGEKFDLFCLRIKKKPEHLKDIVNFFPRRKSVN